MRHNIDWSLIGKAVDFYYSARFKYIEVPWIVEPLTIMATLPQGRRPFYVDSCDPRVDVSALVGSAEQSFLQMMLDGKLSRGSYVAVSPCFRDDDVDELHHKDFVKCELIVVTDGPSSLARVRELAMEAALFFRKIGGVDSQHLRLVETDTGLDLELGGIEIGSYGARSWEGHHWIYGTGCAEPRFSQAMGKLRR